MTRNERITFFISVAALLVSAVSFYYQFLFENEDLQVSVISVGAGNSIQANLAVINNGNRQAAILKAQIARARKGEDDSTDLFDGWFRDEQKVTNVPIVLAPGEIKLITVSAPNKVSENILYETGESTDIADFDEYPNPRKIRYGLDITSMNSKGVTHQGKILFVSMYLFSQNGDPTKAEHAGYNQITEKTVHLFR